jgi:catechol 2,3-dioxygenase-like lactoylglutathione lyase family enzyme
MIKRVSIITVVVKDQEEALKWYTEKLGFQKRMDQNMGKNFRWVSIGLPEQKDVELTLVNWKWYGDRNQDQIGKNSVVVLETSNCKEDYENLKAKGVKFTSSPEGSAYGISAVFVDLYGNPYNIVERKAIAS